MTNHNISAGPGGVSPDLEQVATTDVLHTVEPNEPSMLRKIASRVIIAATLGTGVGTALAHDVPARAIDGIEHLADKGFTPKPPVSSTTTEILMNANDVLLDVGPYVLAGEVLIFGSLLYKRRRNQYLKDAFKLIESRNSGIIGKLSPIILIGSVAASAGLGSTAGTSANQPIKELQKAIGVTHGSPAFVLTQHERVIPFNHSDVTIGDIDKLIKAKPESAQIVPYILALGDINNPTDKANPSSAPIVALPNDAIKKAYDVSLPATDSCDSLSVIVGEQLGVKPGSKVEVEGVSVEVAKTIDIAPGLDRVAVFGSLEQLQECIFKDEQYSGAVALGFDDQKEVTAYLKSLDVHLATRTFAELEKAYESFWNRSVKPPQMNFVMYLLLASSIGEMFIGATEVERHKKIYAMLNSQGNQKDTFRKIELLRTVRRNVLAIPFAGALTLGLTYATNGSQYGFREIMDSRLMGAGLTAMLIPNLVGYIGTWRTINRLDTPTEIRQSI